MNSEEPKSSLLCDHMFDAYPPAKNPQTSQSPNRESTKAPPRKPHFSPLYLCFAFRVVGTLQCRRWRTDHRR